MGKYSLKYNNTASYDVRQTCFIITETVLTLHSLALHSTTDHFVVNKKNQLDVTFVFFISLLIVAQHVSGNHVPIIRS